MIIKYYTTQDSIVIIDGAQDVEVYKEKPEYAEGYDYFVFSDEQSETPMFISYAKEGPCLLRVDGVAYVCNDEGKTIEKVGPSKNKSLKM